MKKRVAKRCKDTSEIIGELNQNLADLLKGRYSTARMGFESGSENSQVRQNRAKQRLMHEVVQDLEQKGLSASCVCISVAHTSFEKESWVLVIGSDQSVGVDIERQVRWVGPGVLPRITTEQERSELSWDVLQFWVVKEAAFKANPKNDGTVLPQYPIKYWDPNAREGIVALPGTSLRCRFRLLDIGPWWIALAHVEDLI